MRKTWRESETEKENTKPIVGKKKGNENGIKKVKKEGSNAETDRRTDGHNLV